MENDGFADTQSLNESDNDFMGTCGDCGCTFNCDEVESPEWCPNCGHDDITYEAI